MAENGGGHALQCHLALSRNRPELGRAQSEESKALRLELARERRQRHSLEQRLDQMRARVEGAEKSLEEEREQARNIRTRNERGWQEQLGAERTRARKAEADATEQRTRAKNAEQAAQASREAVFRAIEAHLGPEYAQRMREAMEAASRPRQSSGYGYSR